MAGLDDLLKLAVEHHQAGRFPQAEQAYRVILQQHPNHVEATHHLGLLAFQTGNAQAGEALLLRALQLNPNLAVAYYNLGCLYKSTGRDGEAARCFEKTIALHPNYSDAHAHLAEILEKERATLDRAIDHYRRALALAPANRTLEHRLGNALLGAGRGVEAVACFQHLIASSPNDATLYNALGTALRLAGRIGDGRAAYKRALAIDPQNPLAHWHVATELLARGDWERGWAEYEWRWRCDEFSTQRREFSQPQWQGEDVAGKTIFVYSEQGLGDAIQFSRLATVLASKGAKAILEVPPSLRDLLRTVDGIAGCISLGDPVPQADFVCPLMSLPHLLHITPQTLPHDVPYVRCDPDLAREWSDRVTGASKEFNIGLAWSAGRATAIRSLSLNDFAPLAGVEGVKLFSLQVGEAAIQAKSPPSGLKLIDWTDRLTDFSQTAALIDALDLVISADTSVLHVAGALAKPVWVVVPRASDWRWMLDRNDSPWYPTLRLFRQPTQDDWRSAVANVVAALPSLVTALKRG